MSVYDPLGIIGHIIMYVKVFMQEVWRSKIDWDEKIPPELALKSISKNKNPSILFKLFKKL